MSAIMMFLLVLALYRLHTIDELKKEYNEKIEHYKKIAEELERRINMQEITKQCENEDIAKELLLKTKYKTAEEQSSKRELLNGILEKRKNLYIYPEQVNA